jgi:hypothetical protein
VFLKVSLALAVSLLSSLALASTVAAQSAPGASAWAGGPAASGDSRLIAGVIDAPQANATLSAATFQVAGWFVDQSAQGWAGADDVEIFVGTMDSGRPLAHAQFAQNRPDVANALHNGYWTPSGWSATIPLTALPAGANTLSVYAHTPGKGWWYRQTTVNVAPPRGSSAPSPVQSTLGYDISYPQCPTGAEGPNPSFGIVGINDGIVFTGNPCLPRQYVWALTSSAPAQSHIDFYMNTGNPGPATSRHWPAPGTSSPRSCDGSWSNDCAYDYGWAAAQDAYARAVAVAGASTPRIPWWLDVETANSWSTDTASNAATLEGTLDGLRSLGVSQLGIYSSSADWGTIVGEPSGSGGAFAGLPNWRPGAQSLQDAPSWCTRTVTGGRVKLVQFQSSGLDADFVCF